MKETTDLPKVGLSSTREEEKEKEKEDGGRDVGRVEEREPQSPEKSTNNSQKEVEAKESVAARSVSESSLPSQPPPASKPKRYSSQRQQQQKPTSGGASLHSNYIASLCLK